MRMVLGLDHPTAGSALIDGVAYATFRHPLRRVGAVLDAKAVHPGRSARNHLLAMARSNGIPIRRVDAVLETVGLADVAGRRAGTFSLGMSQRLGIAGALLGDPAVLLFDEPVNGLDPDGVRWIRGLMRSLADEGRTVFVSSHLMSEMQLTADHLVVIGRGRLLVDAAMTQVIGDHAGGTITVRSPAPAGLEALRERLLHESIEVVQVDGGELLVRGAQLSRIGDAAHELGVPLHELSARASSLEEAYMQLTADSVEYAAPEGGSR